jgi:integrase
VNCSYVFNQLVDRVDNTGNKIKKAIPYGDIKKSFASAVKRAKIHDFKFHDLRHTFASHLVMAGVDITTVKELLGHKDIKMTLRYAHLAPSHKVKAVDVLDRAINGNKQSTIHLLYTSTKMGEKVTHLPVASAYK